MIKFSIIEVINLHSKKWSNLLILLILDKICYYFKQVPKTKAIR